MGEETWERMERRGGDGRGTVEIGIERNGALLCHLMEKYASRRDAHAMRDGQDRANLVHGIPGQGRAGGRGQL